MNHPSGRTPEMLAQGVYAGRIQAHRDLRLLNQNETLSSIKDRYKKIKIKKSFISVFIAALIAPLGANSAQATSSTDHYKLYLHTKVIDYKGFHCAVSVAQIESRWNPSAVNGSHYGLFQMRNKKVQYMNPYTQIDWWHRYLQTRYKGDACIALAHLKSKGWH